MADAVRGNDVCFNGSIFKLEDGLSHVMPDADNCCGADFRINGPGIDAMAQRATAVLDAFDEQCLPVAAKITDGGLEQEAELFMEGASTACDGFQRYEVVIDADGYVEDIIGEEGQSVPEVVQCVREAFDGLVFPCMADTRLSYVMALII